MTSEERLITVLMTVYNGEQFLQTAIDSILAQSFSDFEFLIVDDASTDGTPDILANASSRDARVRIFRNEQNLGLTKSLNIGLKLANGHLIARLDADDISAPDRLAKQLETMNQNPHVDVLGSAAEIIDEVGNPVPGCFRGARTPSQIKAQLLFSNPITHSSVMFRLDAIRKIGGYDEGFQRAQDFDLWLRCLASDLSLEMLDESLVQHRLHNRRVTIQQPLVMEESHCSALEKGYREVLGLNFPKKSIHDLQTLRLQCKPFAGEAQKQILRSLRKAVAAFRRRFANDGEAINAYRTIVRRLASFAVPDTNPNKQLYVEYAAGSSFSLYVVKRSVYFCKRKASRLRVKVGYVRRKLVNRTTD